MRNREDFRHGPKEWGTYFDNLLIEQEETVAKLRSEGKIVDYRPHQLGYMVVTPPQEWVEWAEKEGLTIQEWWDRGYKYG